MLKSIHFELSYFQNPEKQPLTFSVNNIAASIYKTIFQINSRNHELSHMISGITFNRNLFYPGEFLLDSNPVNE